MRLFAEDYLRADGVFLLRLAGKNIDVGLGGRLGVRSVEVVPVTAGKE